MFFCKKFGANIINKLLVKHASKLHFLANYTPSNNPTQIGTGAVAQLGERKFRKLMGSAFETYLGKKQIKYSLNEKYMVVHI